MSNDFFLGILAALALAIGCAILWMMLSLLWDHLMDETRRRLRDQEVTAKSAREHHHETWKQTELGLMKIRGRIATIEKKLRIKPK